VTEEQVERFTVWGSRIMGAIGLALVAVALVFGVVGGSAPYAAPTYPVMGLAGLLFWTTLVRPAVAVVDDRLVLRNPFTTVSLPLAAIEQVAVRQWLAVRVGDRRFTNSGVGRSYRQTMRDDRKGDVSGTEIADLSYGAIVERRIDKRAEEARSLQGIALHSDEQAALAADVRREPARIEIGLLVVLLLALAVTLVL
jgi:hypothetical protein